MQASIEIRHNTDGQTPLQRYLAPIAAAIAVGVFLAIPMPLSQKAHAFLHGICAQRPSHTLAFGDGLLPFDARMTGIYTGFLAAMIVLIATGRHRHAGLPSIGAGLVLLAMVGTMAVDGFNSLFTDAGLATPYAPDNRLRVLTGAAAGIGLATILTMLMGMTLWRRPQVRKRVVSRWWEPMALFVATLPLIALLATGWSPLLAPLTLVLVASAVLAFSGLAMVTALLLTNKENRFERAGEVQGYAVIGGMLGIAAIGILAAGRFAFEAWTNAPPLT
ncbi:MAG: DUF2085 domain-containing protein [Thermomicrobiales bacterium]|nr:DUF2085 domain-containing protein [Thermomicrobiales bacterium]